MSEQPKREVFNTEVLERFGKRLREFRKAKGEEYSTAEKAALKLGIQRSQYTRYEAGTANLNFLTLMEVLFKMKIPISEFFSEGFDDIDASMFESDDKIV